MHTPPLPKLLLAAALALCACNNDGGVADATKKGATLALLVSSMTVGSIDDVVEISNADATSQATCPQVTAPITVDGRTLTETQQSGWQPKPELCLGGLGCEAVCQFGMWTSPSFTASDSDTTTVQVGDAADGWTMTVQHAHATRSMTLTSASSAQRGSTVTVAVSPESDDLLRDGVLPDVSFNLPSGTTGTSPTVSADITYDHGVLSFVLPEGLSPGRYTVTFGFTMQPHVLACNGPKACTAFNDNPTLFCTAGSCDFDSLIMLTVE